MAEDNFTIVSAVTRMRLEITCRACYFVFPISPENRRDQIAGGRFQPGKSGNPGGRPKEVEAVRELARQHTGEAIQTLAAIMRDGEEPAAARVRAAECLLDRGWGRSETTANVKLPRDVRDLSTDELLVIIAEEAGARAGIGDGNHEAPHC